MDLVAATPDQIGMFKAGAAARYQDLKIAADAANTLFEHHMAKLATEMGIELKAAACGCGNSACDGTCSKPKMEKEKSIQASGTGDPALYNDETRNTKKKAASCGSSHSKPKKKKKKMSKKATMLAAAIREGLADKSAQVKKTPVIGGVVGGIRGRDSKPTGMALKSPMGTSKPKSPNLMPKVEKPEKPDVMPSSKTRMA